MLVTNGGAGDGASLGAASVGAQFKYNIIVINKSGTNRFMFKDTNFASDYNVFVNVQGATCYWQDSVSGTAFTLAEWRSECGADTNSVLLNGDEANQLFLNGVAGLANGDFRLNPQCQFKFVDGTSIVGNAGIRQFYDWSRFQKMDGAPRAWPILPATEAQCAAYIAAPRSWVFY